MKMKKGKENIKQWFLYLSSFLVIGIVTIIIVFLLKNYLVVSNSSNAEVIDSLEKTYASTVYIESVGDNESEGSGFIYKIDKKYAYILTNEHVVKENTVRVTNSLKKEVQGTVLGKDAYIDLAIVRIDKKYAPKKASFAKNYKLKIGEEIYVIGTPISKQYLNSVVSGIISGKDRIVKTTINGDEERIAMKVLQYDAAINPGNSGGPLVNKNGDVIGICTMKLNQGNLEGMAFAIDVEDILKNIDILEQGNKIKRPDLGITVIDTDDYSSLNKEDIYLSGDIDSGAVISKIKDDSIASKLKVGDVITKIDDIEVTDSTVYKYAIYIHQQGDKIKITYLRDSKEKTININV